MGNPRKVSEIFKYKNNIDAMRLELSKDMDIYWFDDSEIIPIEWIQKEREYFCYKNQWDIDNPLDGWVDADGLVYWWNGYQIYKVYRNLLNKYKPEERLCNTEEMVDSLLKEFNERDNKIKAGYGSPEEREKFYSSLDWSYVKYLRFFIDKGICQSCHIKPTVPEINHLYPICSEKYPSLFIRNLDVDKVETLCPPCHKAFHEAHDNTGYQFV